MQLRNKGHHADGKQVSNQCKHYDENYEALIARQHEGNKKCDTLKEFNSILRGMVQWQDVGPWTHGMIIEKRDYNHND